MKKALIIALGVALAIACSHKPKSASDAAKLYAIYYADGEFDKFTNALDLPSTNVDSTKMAREQIKALLDNKATAEVKAQGGIQKIDILSEAVSENNPELTEVTMREEFKNGEVDTTTYSMILRDGEWKLSITK